MTANEIQKGETVKFIDGDHLNMVTVYAKVLSFGRIYATVLTDGGVKKRVRLSALHKAVTS